MYVCQKIALKRKTQIVNIKNKIIAAKFD